MPEICQSEKVECRCGAELELDFQACGLVTCKECETTFKAGDCE